MEQTPAKKSGAAFYSGLAVVLVSGLLITGGTAASREIGLKRAYDIAKANNLPMSASDIYPRYEGDFRENAATYLGGVYLEPMPKELSSYSVTQADLGMINHFLSLQAEPLRLAEIAADSPVFVATHHAGTLNANWSEVDGIRSCGTLLLSRAVSRAASGNLSDSMVDFRRVVRLMEFARSVPDGNANTYGEALEIAAEHAALKALPYFAGHTEAQQLAALPSTFPLQNFYKSRLGYCLSATNIALNPVTPQVFGGSTYAFNDTNAGFVEATRSAWAPRFLQACADDLSGLKADPYNIDSPALKSPHLMALAANDKAVANFAYDQFFVNHLKRVKGWKELTQIALQAAVSGTMPAVANTRDAFGTGPYKVVTTKSGWTVYSVGTDGKDNGGNSIRTTGGEGDDSISYTNGVLALNSAN